MGILEDKLLEAACMGDIRGIEVLLSKGAKVNAKHSINGWSPLHWAVHRGHEDIVTLLLTHGADKDAVNVKGERALDLAHTEQMAIILGGKQEDVRPQPSLPITPHFLINPPLAPSVDLKIVPENYTKLGSEELPRTGDLLLRIKPRNGVDFFEVEIPRNDLTYKRLLAMCEEELNMEVKMLRRLPNTVIRSDKDVQRLQENQEIEVEGIPKQ
ncbi:unnamed protein product [Darwinula stevensoni]|uniref:Ankyrin repeat domain-containing protein 40 n=1 Tax=Darwinula stevensoni TaxID=69355 RepID=A0A7R8X1F6_9CRUS|nr:unnamed protein product [Darwinula stevensoni]CAG0882241.1 unnamed protein product [Darwinula stevensoni]